MYIYYVCMYVSYIYIYTYIHTNIYVYIYLYDQSVDSSCFVTWESISTAQIKLRYWWSICIWRSIYDIHEIIYIYIYIIYTLGYIYIYNKDT